MSSFKDEYKLKFFSLILAGNPFKIDKRMMVDEADIDMVGSASSNSKTGSLKRVTPPSDSGGPPTPRPPPNKRKPGPIPRDVIVRRPSYSPVNTPPSSPIPWMDETKNQVVPTANSNSISNTSSASGSLNLLSQTVTDKLVNGLAEIPVFFEPTPIEPVVIQPPEIPLASTRVITNNIESPKFEIKTEKTDQTKPDQNSLIPVNDCEESQNSINVESSSEEPLTNHVEERREVKIEKDKTLPKKELEEIRKHNLSVRESVYKEVRKRGKSKLILYYCH